MRNIFLIIVAIISTIFSLSITAQPMTVAEFMESIQGKSLSGEITISEPDIEGIVSVHYTGNENVTIIVTVNGEEVDFENGQIQLNEGHSTITAIVSASGYNTKTKTVEVDWYPINNPHLEGYWIVFIDATGEEVWYELLEANSSVYLNTIDCPKASYQDIARFYFEINGCPYGAQDEDTEAYLGDYEMNPLTAFPSGINGHYYYVYSGYGYGFNLSPIYDLYFNLIGYHFNPSQYYEIILHGDIDNDGFVNADDLCYLIDTLLNIEHWGRADVNGDGVINIEDLTKLIDILLRK